MFLLGAYVLRMLTSSSWIDPFSVSHYSLCWKVCFVCSKRCCLSFLLISIFTACLFSRLSFQSVSSDLEWKPCGHHKYIWVLFFHLCSCSGVFLLELSSPFTCKVVIDRSVLAPPLWIVLLALLHFISALSLFVLWLCDLMHAFLWFDVWIPLPFSVYVFTFGVCGYHEVCM